MTTNNARLNESNAELVTIIRDEIAQTGPIRFDRFMDLALYHPEHGYYQSPEPAPGRSGDFLTAPEAHPIFGATLAAQVVEFDQLLQKPDEFQIIEYGAGSGRLIRPLLAELRQQHPELYERTRYTPVETNTTRLQELHVHLDNGGHSHLIDPKITGNGRTGCVIANEFVDSMPARRITRVDNELCEAFVDWRDGWFIETARPIDDPLVNQYLKRHRFQLRDGEWIELHEGIKPWIAEIDTLLSTGFILTIDYGYPASELFQDHRRSGTLKAYFQHGVSNEFYRGVGKQDLTAHVNLSEIIWHAERHNFQMHELTTQADLLASLGIGDRLVRLQQNPNLSADDYLGIRAAVMRMIDPGAMGRFRALTLSRGIVG